MFLCQRTFGSFTLLVALLCQRLLVPLLILKAAINDYFMGLVKYACKPTSGTAIFKPLQRCSVGFKSRLGLGNSRTFRAVTKPLLRFLGFVLGVIDWKMDLWPSLRSWALWTRFSSRISLYCSVQLSWPVHSLCHRKTTTKHDFATTIIRLEKFVSHGLLSLL